MASETEMGQTEKPVYKKIIEYKKKIALGRESITILLYFLCKRISFHISKWFDLVEGKRRAMYNKFEQEKNVNKDRQAEIDHILKVKKSAPGKFRLQRLIIFLSSSGNWTWFYSKPNNKRNFAEKGARKTEPGQKTSSKVATSPSHISMTRSTQSCCQFRTANCGVKRVICCLEEKFLKSFSFGGWWGGCWWLYAANHRDWSDLVLVRPCTFQIKSNLCIEQPGL